MLIFFVLGKSKSKRKGASKKAEFNRKGNEKLGTDMDLFNDVSSNDTVNANDKTNEVVNNIEKDEKAQQKTEEIQKVEAVNENHVSEKVCFIFDLKLIES